MKRLFFVTVLAQLCLSPLFTNMALAQEGLDDPTRAVVLNMSARAYRPSFWNINSLQSTVYAIDLSHESTLFTVGKSYNSKSFVSYHTLPIPIKRYPILVLTYQATNLLSQPRHALWLDDGTGPNSGGAYAMQSNQFIADGKTHEYHIDLRQLSWRKKQSPLNFITGMCFYIHLGKEAPGEFKILDMRFVTDDDAPSIKPYADDAPMTVKVVDSQGNPIANATVTADDEWSNFARSTKTNSQGQATLTPMTNQANKHILTASADGFAQVRLKQLPPAGPITIILPKGVSLSGIVHNEQGQPIAGAMVNGYATCQTRNRSQYIDCSFAVLTDEQGKWQSPIVAVYPNLTTAPPPVINKLPRTMLQRLLSIPSQTTVVSNAPNTVPQQISLKLGHIDYLSDSTGQSIQALTDGSSIIVMKKGFALIGQVVNEAGKPIPNVRIQPGNGSPRTSTFGTNTNKDGKFTLKRLPAGRIQLSARASNGTKAVQAITVGPDTATIRFELKPKPKKTNTPPPGWHKF